MAFKIEADENMPGTVIQILEEHGYDAISVIQQNMSGWKDPDLWEVVQKEQRFLVTADKGFADVRTFPPGTHAGILLLRPDEDGIRPLIDLLKRVLDSYSIEDLHGAVTVATQRNIRVRKG
jgi:predicted nuclease of predicted toxin-antitoxin system